MAFVVSAELNRRDLACGETLEVKIAAEFDGAENRLISVRIPEAAQCFFRRGEEEVIKVSKPAKHVEFEATFRLTIHCRRKGATAFILFVQASEAGNPTHEVERTITVTC